MRGSITWTVCGGLFAAALAAGCGPARTGTDQRRLMAMDLADVLRREALQISDDAERDKIVSGLVRIREVLGEAPIPKEPPAVLPQPPGGIGPVPPWARMFVPKTLSIGFFTQMKTFENGQPGLEVRVQPLDQFGDPTKAVGSFRIEVFETRPRTGEPMGTRLGHWYVAVLDAESNRKYYDPIDRSYVFPLIWSAGAPGTQVIVQATYYPPGGFDEKIIAQRRIKLGE